MTAVLFISMVILLILGVPIAFVLVGSSALALVADGGTNLSISTIFGWILAREQVPQALAQTFLSISSSKYVFLILINIMLLIVGCFCEAGAAMVILAPLLAPIAQTLGIDLIHFGIIMMTNLAIGMMTPPVGVNLYVVCDSAKVKIEGMMKYLMIYFGVLVVDLMIVTFVPPLSLLIPGLFQ